MVPILCQYTSKKQTRGLWCALFIPSHTFLFVGYNFKIMV